MGENTSSTQKVYCHIYYQGSIEGEVCYDGSLKYYSFKSIPYALIPMRNLRFAPPLSILPWLFADTQKRSLEMGYGGDNTLMLNIYTPEFKPFQPDAKIERPVIVFIPGDLTSVEYSALDYHGPQFMLRENVVVVTVSYRSGIMGFLRFEDLLSRAPGNVGLMDLQMAFAWIRRNVIFFGGCPNNITAYGQGYGATHLRHLLMSDLFENSFDKMILSSPIEHKMSDAYMKNGSYIGSSFAKEIRNFSKNSDETFADFLREAPIEDITATFTRLTIKYTVDMIESMDLDLLNDQFYKAKIPVIIGFNSQESLMDYQLINDKKYDDTDSDNDTENVIKNSNEKSTRKERKFLRRFLVRHRAVPEVSLVAQYSKEFIAKHHQTVFERLNGKTTREHYVMEKPHFVSDLSYLIRIMAITRTLADEMLPKNKPVYLYRFDVNLSLNYSNQLRRFDTDPGSSHGDELAYIFKHPNTTKIIDGSHEDLVIDKMTRLWTQFAKTGNPNLSELEKPIWMPIQNQLDLCLNISNTGIAFSSLPDYLRLSHWEMAFRKCFFSDSKKIYQNKGTHTKKMGRTE